MDQRDNREDSSRTSALRRYLEEVESELANLEARRNEIDQHIERKNTERTYLRGLLDIRGAGGGPLQLPRLTNAAADAAELVVALLRETGSPLHYRAIEKELRSSGQYVAGGQDPANTLLAHYFNDPRLYRPSRGTYGLREWDKSARSVGTKRRKAGIN